MRFERRCSVCAIGENRVMVHVILDANAVGTTPPLNTVEHRILLDAHRAGAIVLVIPELSLREAIHAWGRELKKRVDTLSTANRRLAAIAPKLERATPRVDYAEAAARLREELGESLATAQVWMPGLPEVEHEEIVARALLRRKPFDKNGDGYRDALLWHVVLGVATTGVDVVLISNDRSAFSHEREGALALAEPLSQEIVALGATARLFADPRAAIEGLGLVASEALDAAVAVVKRRGSVILADHLRDELVEQLFGTVAPPAVHELVDPALVERAALDLAFLGEAVEVQDARIEGSGRIEATAHLVVLQFVKVFVDLRALPAVASLGAPNAPEDGLGSVEIAARVTHACRLVLDPLDDAVIDAQPLGVVQISRR